MGKFKETNEKVYVSETSAPDQTHYFVQPTFVGLIELFKNLNFNLEIAKHAAAQADFSNENDQLERERTAVCTPQEFCSVV